MNSQILFLFHDLCNCDVAENEHHSACGQYVKVVVMAIEVAVPPLELALVVLVMVSVSVLLEPLPHLYEPFVMTEMKKPQLAQLAAAAPGLQVMV